MPSSMPRLSLLRRAALPAAILFGGSALTGCGGSGSGAKLPSISGAGATFPAAAYQRWSGDYAAGSGNQVNYQSVGSGAGVRQFTAGTVDFGATDEQLSDEEFAATAKRGALQIPMLGGTVTPAYNKPECTDLRLTQAQLADIYLGKIKTWHQLKCGSGPITVVHRSDGSGTTYAFTNSLSCFSDDWKSKVGKGKAVKWPVGVGAKGNEGVAGSIANTPGAIGYVNQAYVRGTIKAASLQNRDGQFVKADSSSGAAALAAVALNERLGGEDCNPAGSASFPIVAFSWILAYEKGYGPEKAKAVRSFLEWSLGDGAQKQASSLGYVPLTGEVLSRARQAVTKIAD
ncbi:MAG: phosphate ABC transporter substrate-binding protein PstS [Cyanobacteriota bacterium]